MADITIIRNGARISLANFPKLGSGSENIAVAVSASGAYDTYTTELYYGWYQGSSMQKMIAKYQNGLYYIPSNALFNAGNVYLTLRLVSGGNKVSTNTIPITVEKSAVNNEYSILPASETWQNAVDNYINNSNSLLNKRLDNIVSQSGNDNTEIVDARLGADGVTYNTLGKAVRTQVNNLNNDKVDKPSTTDDGKIARAKSGKVEWVDVGQPTDAQTESAVTRWLDNHPEATTSVQDKSISVDKLTDDVKSALVYDHSLNETKFSNELKVKTIKDYVTPEMFGAKGDGVTDDTGAIQKTIDSGANLIGFSNKTYIIKGTLNIDRDNIFFRGSSNPSYNFTNGTILKCSENESNVFNIGLTKRVFSIGFKDLTIIAEGSSRVHQNLNNKRMVLNCNQVTDMQIHNVIFLGFNNTVLNLIDTFDCSYHNMYILICGNTNTPAILMTGEKDNTNAQHFVSCRIEHCPYSIKLDNCVNNTFTNCKCEIGTTFTDVRDGVITITSNSNHGNVFSGCFFAHSKSDSYLFSLGNQSRNNTIDSCVFDAGGKYINIGTSYENNITNNQFNNASDKCIYINNGYKNHIMSCMFFNGGEDNHNYIYVKGHRNVITMNSISPMSAEIVAINIEVGDYNIVFGNDKNMLIAGSYYNYIGQINSDKITSSNIITDHLALYDFNTAVENNITITLPVSPIKGQLFFIAHSVVQFIIATSDNKNIWYNGVPASSSVTVTTSKVGILVCLFLGDVWFISQS